MPGSQTASQVTFRTYVYQLFDILGRSIGYYPRAPENVTFSYSILGVLQPSLSGDNAFCTISNPYIISNLPNNATVTWSASPSGIVQINSPNSQQTTLTKIKAGLVTLNAEVGNLCGASQNLNISRSIAVGSPKPGPISWEWNAPPNRVSLYVDPVPGVSSYKWYLDGVLKATTTSSTYRLPMSGNVSCGNFYYFGVRAVNVCGSSEESYLGATMPPCDFYYKISPNPSSGNLIIESVTASKSENNQIVEIQKIELFDKIGSVKYKQQFIKGTTLANISVAMLPNDIYTIRIFDGKAWHAYKIVVQH